MPGKLVRWRADPQRVRVAVQRQPNGAFKAIVTIFKSGLFVVKTGLNPRTTMMRALRALDGHDGIDLGMGWTYEHPFKTEESENAR